MPVMSRPMFRPRIVRRQEGSSPMGEMYDFDIQMKQKPEMDSYGQNLMNPEFQNFLLSVYGDKGQGILDTLLVGNTPENFSLLNTLLNEFTNFKIANEMKEKGAVPPKSDTLPEEEMNFLNRLKNMAEGGEMTSDAVGIADGLDAEEETMTAVSEPSDAGIAKVSPEQYVQLMNEVRGDEVPLEGRVQELAMKVGEQDAQDTPLSVLALVQPVFELEEQGGLAQTQQAQAMAQPMMQMANGGIVKRSTGSDPYGELGVQLGIDPERMAGLASLFGLTGQPVNVGQRSQEITDLYLDRANIKDKAKLMASPYLLALASKVLDPEAEMKDIFLQGAGSLAQFGTDFSKMKQPYEQLGLKMALEEQSAQKEKQGKFVETLGGKIIDNMFKEEKLIVDPYTNMLVSNITGKPPEQNKEEYNNQVLFKQAERMNNNAKLTVVDDLLTLPDLTEADRAQIRLDPNEWLKRNADKTAGKLTDVQKKKVEIEDKMRGDFDQSSKDFKIRANAYQTIKASVDDPSAAGDLALIFNFMKLLDPASTVREGEFANAENAAGVPERVRVQWNKLKRGERLTPNQRNDFLNQTQNIYESALTMHQKLIDQTKEIANRYADTYDVDWNNIIFDYTVPDPTLSFTPEDFDDSAFDTGGN